MWMTGELILILIIIKYHPSEKYKYFWFYLNIPVFLTIFHKVN